ncbi:MAG: HTH-type transcriptional regulator MetR [Paracidovorax wautersii]|uniref:HTH-type transcriptional regulator MetR n=1 Tax=Paracidovorax wautersii TaxID=1177982 RepID=A0A7V8JQX9_9BURK|nr:MAG: HTH-type transcriptional regulator MetR [Paracidovorax wautersii]
MQRPHLQLDWLHVFVAVVDGGSLSAAAPAVHRSPSAVSMQLQKLEQAVGQQLLHRSARSLALTPAGTELLGYARRMLALHDETLDALNGPALSGEVRMGVPDDYATRYLTPVLRDFAARHAGVDILLDCEQSTALIPKLRRGELDLALVSRDRPSLGRLLFKEPMVWVGAPESRVWQRQPLPIAVYEAASMARRGAVAALARQGRDYRMVYNSSSLVGQVAAVKSGIAIAALTRCSVPPDLEILGERHGLPALPPMEVALVRARGVSRREPAIDALYRQIVHTLAAVIEPD